MTTITIGVGNGSGICSGVVFLAAKAIGTFTATFATAALATATLVSATLAAATFGLAAAATDDDTVTAVVE